MKKNVAVFAGGCFWCLDSIFRKIKGVSVVESGYAGGIMENPNYDMVCTGTTGHAEAVKIEYDMAIISYEKLLEIFFAFHDPTTLNRQGNDIGSQYRSVIFYINETQRREAEKFIAQLEKKKAYSRPIVTGIEPLVKFYQAEKYHQDYFDKNPKNAYCSFTIGPKLKKLAEKFPELLI
jgi:peptide-methionine (S)-S-oxide reductase